MRNLILIVSLILLIGACGQAPQESPDSVSTDPATSAGERQLPAGFLDEPPPPPTSNSLVLSGGTLISPAQITDAIVVVTDGRLVGWGKRGAVDVPNDSIGYDMRGKFIVPGAESDLERDQLPVLDALTLQVPASFLIMEHYGSPEVALLGYLKGSELVVETETD